MTFGSLFAGIGGIDLGLERAGLICRWQVEIDPFCRQVLEKHWPKVPKYGDITKLSGEELERVDLICGGFPCQDLSQAGKRSGIEGSRSGLWFEFARIIGVVGPRFVLIENVPGLLVPGAMRRVVGELAGLGYVGLWRSLRASEFGASHLRKRVFIVAYGIRSDSERWRDTGIMGTPASKEPGQRLQRQRTGYATDDSGNDLAHCEHAGRIVKREAFDGNGHHASGNHTDRCDPIVAHTGGSQVLPYPGGAGLEKRRCERSDNAEKCATAERDCGTLAFAPGPADSRWPAILKERPDLAPALESPVRGMADGLPGDLDGAMRDRTKRLGRLGNAVVPQVAEWIGRRILEIETEI